jgi:hypothetical protein
MKLTRTFLAILLLVPLAALHVSPQANRSFAVRNYVAIAGGRTLSP